jgi:crotonobetainyl-CoA:carnitine CoA-transferase CaiB-like acyl-CoA transferase
MGDPADHAALHEAWSTVLATRPTAEWLEVLGQHDVLCAPVLTTAEALESEQTRVNGMLLDIERENQEPLLTVGCPVHLSRTPATVRLPPPSLGANTEEVLAELAEEARKSA